MRRLAIVLGGVVTVACSEAPAPSANVVEPAGNAVAPVGNEVDSAAETAKPLLNIAPGAIALVDAASGSSRELAFGTAKDIALPAAIRALGEPKERGINNECGEGAMDYVTFDGLSLWFQQDKLVGWFLREGAGNVSTAAGVGVGSTFAAVKSAYAVAEVDGSTLGREFSTADGSMSGLLGSEGENAKVTSLWSGQACLMR